MSKQNQGGRPPSYSPEQLAQAVDIVEANEPGSLPGAKSVKDVLCQRFGVSSGLNLQSLERELDRFILERGRRRDRELVDALPEVIRAAGTDAAKSLETQVLTALGKGFAEMQAQAARTVAILGKDKSLLHRRIEDLEADAAEISLEIHRITEVVGAQERDLAEAGRAHEDAKATIRDFETATGTEARVLRELRLFFAERGVDVGQDVTPDQTQDPQK